MDANLRPSGIEGVGDMSWGTHVCLFYETKEDLLDVFIPFFKAGLEHQEFCLCVASEPLMAEEAERAMRQAIPDFERYVAEEQLEITPHTDWYLKDGYFDEERVLQGWIDKLDQALAKGFSGVRFAANILLEKRDWENFAQYEGKLEESLHGLQIEGLCAYRLNRYSAANILDVIRHHQFTLARRDGAWEPLEGAQLKRAHAEVLKLNAELEQRVAERTAELAAANEQLRREITERKRSETRLQAAIDAADIVLWERDLSSGQITWLGHHEKLLGFASGELGYNTLGDFEKRVHPEDIDGLRRIRQRALEERSEYSHEYRVVWRDGSIHWIRAQGRFIYNEAGQPTRLYGAVLDITESRVAEEALRTSERVLREAEALGHTGSWEQNLVTGEIFNTEENLRLFFGDDRSKGANFEDYAQVVHPDDRDYVMRRRVELLEEEGPGEIEYRVVWPDGSVHVIFGRATVVRDELGQAIRVYGTNVDITERKRAEELIRKSERVLREAESLGHTGSWEKNLVTGEIFHTEENLRLFFGDDRSSSKVTFLADYNQAIHPDDREYVMQRRIQLLAEGGPRDIEFRVVLPDGSIHILFSRATVVYDELGQAIRVYGTNMDITERKQAETTIRSLLHISENLHRNLETDKLLEALIIEAMKLTDSELGWVGLPTEKGMTLVRHISHNFEVVPFEYTWAPGIGWPGWVLVHKIPYISNNAGSDKVIVPEIREQFGVKSGIDTPILDAHGEVIGFFEVNNKKNEARFSTSDVEKLIAVSRIASIALQNARLFEQVQEAREQLEALSHRLLKVQESERRALTTELHDRVGQNLTGLSILLQNLKTSLSGEARQNLVQKFNDAQSLLQDTTRHIRDIMAELYLPELEDHGLAAALETYAERAASRGNLDLLVDLPETSLSLSSDARVALFRAAQEAISNVLKHADATQLEISLQRENGRVRLKVEDNGQGFEPGAAAQKETPSWGLKIMRERIESIGGKVEIESEPGEGTRVTFEIERSS